MTVTFVTSGPGSAELRDLTEDTLQSASQQAGSALEQ